MNCHGDVLLADDQETFRESTADLLRNEGYRCDIAADASEAGRLLHVSRYDVLISDIRMPGNAGLEFVGSLKETAAGMPIILVTGYPSLTSAVYAVQLPVIAYLIKPLDFDELLPFVQAAVERSRAYRTIYESRRRLEGLSEALRQVENALCDSTGLPGPSSPEDLAPPRKTRASPPNASFGWTPLLHNQQVCLACQKSKTSVPNWTVREPSSKRPFASWSRANRRSNRSGSGSCGDNCKRSSTACVVERRQETGR
jgi:FixJ family two-component response regulator